MFFSNLNSNCSNILDLRNLQEQVKKAFCFKNWSDFSLFEYIVLKISKSFSQSIEHFFLSRSEQFWKQNTISKKLYYMDAYLIQKLKQNFRDRYEYFWAGAKISRGTLFWENGRSERISKGKNIFYLILQCSASKFCRQSKFGSYQKKYSLVFLVKVSQSQREVSLSSHLQKNVQLKWKRLV